jgi:glycosylphosphatidylinositol transamidase (GPIT) subunit GPI8
MEHQPKCKQMTTAAQQGTFIYLHGHRNEEGLEHGALAQAATLFFVSHNAYGLFCAR